ncbi:MAG: hypothetical protein LBD87_03840 [Prevotellaceae bacterium]|jgi:hypothetical protein|nr:hypothetical protein [Prevotellaceae bacterium]
MKTDFIPASDAAFDAWQYNLLGKVASRAPALNIPLNRVAGLQTMPASA